MELFRINPPEQYYIYFPSGQSIHLSGDIKSKPDFLLRTNNGYFGDNIQIQISIDSQFYSLSKLCTLFSTKLGKLNIILHNQDFQQMSSLVVEDIEFLDCLNYLQFEKFTVNSQQQSIVLHCSEINLLTNNSIPPDFLHYQRDFKLGLLGI